MKTTIPDTTLFRLAEASLKSSFRSRVADTVTKHFRSMHYLSSTLVCDCIVLNILLNDAVTPNSADEILVAMRRKTNSFYTTVESAYFPIEDKFEEYAKSVLGEKYAEIKAADMRTVNYIVYVISTDVSRQPNLYPNEIYSLAYTYEELLNIELPHY